LQHSINTRWKNNLVLFFFVCLWRGLNKVTLQHMGCPKQKMGWIIWRCNLCENASWCPKLWSWMMLQYFFMNTWTLVWSWYMKRNNLLNSQKKRGHLHNLINNFCKLNQTHVILLKKGPMLMLIHIKEFFPNHVFWITCSMFSVNIIYVLEDAWNL